MSEPLEVTILSPLMSLSVDSHVKTSATPEAALVYQANDPDSGMSSRESLAKWDPDSLSWRTSRRLLFADLMPYSEPWPIWGSMRNGELFQHQPLVPRNTGNVFFCWPTPNAMAGTEMRQRESPEEFSGHRRRHAEMGQRKQLSLEVAVKAFPTGPIPWNQEAMIDFVLSNPGCFRASGVTNPIWCEWLMGYPMGWTDLGD